MAVITGHNCIVFMFWGKKYEKVPRFHLCVILLIIVNCTKMFKKKTMKIYFQSTRQMLLDVINVALWLYFTLDSSGYCSVPNGISPEEQSRHRMVNENDTWLGNRVVMWLLNNRFL